MPDFTMKPTFPVASVIDAAQRNNQLQLQAQQAGQQSLVQGLKSIGQIGQSLYDQKLKMAQALAGAKMYAQTPEGQQMLGTNTVTSGPSGQPVMENQTAAYNPATGTATPNQSPVNLQTIQTAMLGESPMAVQNQLFERQKQSQQFGLEQRKQALAEKIEPQKVALDQQIKTLLASIDAKKAGTEATHVENEDTNSLLTRRGQLVGDLSALPDWLSPKSKAARAEIDNIDAVLAKKNGTKASSAGATGSWTQTSSGTSYKVKP